MVKRRVVITGFGILSPVGNTADETWKGLISGKNGIDNITLFDTTEFTTKFAGEVKGFDPEAHFDKKEARKMDRYAHFAVVASDEAIKHSGLDFEKEDRDRVGVIIGSGIGGMGSFETENTKLVKSGPRRVSPFFIVQMISDIAAGHVSIKYNLKGPNYATVSACASSAHAIGISMRTIQYGDADIMVCGGSEATVTEMGVAGFNSMKALSTRNDDPTHASRPFDKERDGFIIGEGAGIMILEELEHAKKRGATIYGEMGGMGFSADAFHVTQPAPEGEGAKRAMKLAVSDAGLKLTDIGYINAHGTSTYFNDKNETAAIKSVFGEHAKDLLISSTKSMTGHMLGAAGGLELIVSTLAITEGKVPPTINYEFPDPECDLNYVPNKYIDKEVFAAASNSFGFGGHNVSLVVKKYIE